MGDAEDFWPPMEDVEDAKSPVVLLRKQAEALTDKSGHRLRGRVSTATIRLPNSALRNCILIRTAQIAILSLMCSR